MKARQTMRLIGSISQCRRHRRSWSSSRRSDQSSSALKNCAKHLFRQLPGRRVLLAGVVRADEHGLASPGAMLAIVSEDKIGAAGDFPLIAKDSKVSIESQLA